MDVNELASLFSRVELIDIASMLDISTVGVSDTDITDAIIQDIDTNGVPEADDDVLLSFLFEAGYIDANGDLIENEAVVEALEATLEEGVDDVTEQEEIKLPECFSWADQRDPACRKCKVFQMCAVKRINSRPLCFGKLHSDTAEECLVCIEFANCREAMTQ